MQVLDPRVRCNSCGEPLPDARVTVCPGCGADLGVVGTRSEVRGWAVTRRRGRRRFVWVRSVLGWGGLAALFSCAGTAVVRRAVDPAEYALAAAPWLVAGYVLGRVQWAAAEREYAAWTAGRGAAEPIAAADPARPSASGDHSAHGGPGS
jgi:hypothetical protein